MSSHPEFEVSKSNVLKFAVVGAGHMGSNHIKKINAIGAKIGAKVSVIVEPDELRGRSFQTDGSDSPRVVSNIGALSQLGPKDYPDAAIVAVPASIHVEATQACLTKGLHCLVEKPLGFSAAQVGDIDRLARDHKRYLQVGLLERWSLCHLWKDWSPKPGVWTINSVRSGPFVPRAADTDVIQDLMVHDLDLFVFLNSVYPMGKIKNVRAWGRKVRSDKLDQAIVALDLEGGGMARFFTSRLAADAQRGWEMTGPGWHASIDFMRRSLKRFEKVGRDMNAFQATENYWEGGDPLGFEIETFVKRVRGEKNFVGLDPNVNFKLGAPEKLIPTANTVIKCHEIIDEVLSCIQVLDQV